MTRTQLERGHPYPDPIVPEPDDSTVTDWVMCDSGAEATDGCWVEPDGTCPHGHPSWLLVMGVV